MTPKELRAASASTRNAHYTAKPVVDFMWRAAMRMLPVKVMRPIARHPAATGGRSARPGVRHG